MWTGLVWLRTVSSSRLLWARQWSNGLHKRHRTSCLTEQRLACLKLLWSIQVTTVLVLRMFAFWKWNYWLQCDTYTFITNIRLSIWQYCVLLLYTISINRFRNSVEVYTKLQVHVKRWNRKMPIQEFVDIKNLIGKFKMYVIFNAYDPWGTTSLQYAWNR
jgi:hypothetical protein